MNHSWYVTDSFSHTSRDFASTGLWHFPGAYNSDAAWSNSKPVTVDWFGGELGYIVYIDSLGGLNADVYMCLYDLSNVVNGIAQPVLVGGQPVILKFLASDGSPQNDGLLMNGVTRLGQYSRSARYITKPIRLGGVTTPATGGPFQCGALFRFFGPDNVALNYQYFLHGEEVDADLLPGGTPPPPPPPATNYATLAIGGQTYRWPIETVLSS